MLLVGTVTSKVGDAMTPALIIRNNVTGNAMEHLKSVEQRSALYLATTRTPARTSATITPNPVKANAQHQTQFFAAPNV